MTSPRDVVQQLIDHINAHEPGAARPLFGSEVEIVSATGRVLTVAGLGQLMAHTLAAFPDLEVRVERWIEAGDVVVTEEVMSGTHRGEFGGLAPTGKEVRLPMCHVTRVVDGRIVERRTYHDSAGILRQLRRA